MSGILRSHLRCLWDPFVMSENTLVRSGGRTSVNLVVSGPPLRCPCLSGILQSHLRPLWDPHLVCPFGDPTNSSEFSWGPSPSCNALPRAMLGINSGHSTDFWMTVAALPMSVLTRDFAQSSNSGPAFRCGESGGGWWPLLMGNLFSNLLKSPSPLAVIPRWLLSCPFAPTILV